jgi:hypothetical protein
MSPTRKRINKIGGVIFGVVMVATCIRKFSSDEPGQATNAEHPQPVTAAVVSPPTQSATAAVAKSHQPMAAAVAGQPKDFLKAMQGFGRSYDVAPNEIKKSQIFNNARDYENHFFGPAADITQWRGTMDGITTSKGGKSLALRVRLGGGGDNEVHVNFEQGYELFGDVIEPNNPVYNQAAELSEGQCVLFSGHVNSKESSVTETLAMSQPSYAIKFTELKPCPK